MGVIGAALGGWIGSAIFGVGLENFWSLQTWLVAILGSLLVLFIGHGLNVVMGLLSVVVHGVRLNLLEFSGQLGMEWAGIAYDPFKKRDKIKK